MTIHPWEAFLAGALVASDGVAPVEYRRPPGAPETVDVSWSRDVPILMELCLAAARGDQDKIAASVRELDLRAVLSIAVGVLVGLATVAVARGEGNDVGEIFAMWADMARQA